MELEEMKNAWAQMSVQVEKQKKLTDKLILDMTQQRYVQGIKKIRTPEIASTVLSLAFVVLILLNLNKYGTGYILACALVSALILLVLPVLSLGTLSGLKAPRLSEWSYKELISWYAVGKRRFLSVQQASIFLGGMLVIISPPVALRIADGKIKDLDFSSWLGFLIGGLLFFAVFATWVYRYYKKTISSLELLLKDLEDHSGD